MEIRAMVGRDIGGVTPLLAELGYSVLESELSGRFLGLDRDRNAVFLVEDGQSVVAWMHLSVKESLVAPPSVEIAALIVRSSHQGRGIGRRLVERAREWAKELGLSNLRVTSNLKRDGSHRFYTHLGFEKKKESAVYHQRV